jgi:hypothetical protein
MVTLYSLSGVKRGAVKSQANLKFQIISNEFAKQSVAFETN